MIDMDRQKAFAVLGLPDDASREEIEALVSERRRKLRQRIVFASTAEQRESSERALVELEKAHAVAILIADDPDASPPTGIKLDISEGTVLDDRYVIRRRVGYGENGAVFAALDLSWGKEIALKVIRPELLLVPGTFERLEERVRQVFDLAHSGVVNVYGVSKIDGHVFIAMELLPDRNLRTVLNESPPPSGAHRGGLPVGQVVDIVQDICTALDYARTRTLHLNLKPDNIIVTDDGFVKVSDFGLDPILSPALQITSPTAREQRRYRAPELARQSETGSAGSISIDERADQYSVAAIAHFLLLAAAPYPDPSPMALKHMGLGKSMASVLSRALSSEPRERFPTIAEFATAFKRAAQNRVSRRIFASTLGAAVVAVVAVASLSITLNQSVQSDTRLGAILEIIPGLSPKPSPNRDVIILQDRVLNLAGALTDQQNALRRKAIEGRIDVRGKAQAVDLAETDIQYEQAQAEYAAIEAEHQRVLSLREIANPEIFNSPDTLNAINLIGLADEHLSEGRYEAARSALVNAERVFSEKLKDYEQARALVESRFSDTENGKSVGIGTPGTREPDQLRRDWQTASQARRRFSAEIQRKMVTIPAGSFEMGDIAGIGNQTERPIRTVLVPSFQLSAFEVTVADYHLCIVDQACPALLSDSQLTSIEEDRPMTGVSWFDVQIYFTWLSQKTGEDYRLPNEAEWEYAARSGRELIYPWGASFERGRANCVNCGNAWEGLGVAPVGSFAPNDFGLFDMAGNVWEWTSDCWYADYTGAPAIAIARQQNAICSERTLRGGSWENDAWLARTTYRGRSRADMRHDLNGFRVAKSVD